MLPELHAVKVLSYAKYLGVVTSGHVTKMAVKPFDLPLLKTPCYTETLRLYIYRSGVIADLFFFAFREHGISRISQAAR